MIDRHAHLWKVYGSVLPRSLVWGILGAIQAALLDASDWTLFKYRNGPGGSAAEELWHHPYTVNVLGIVIGYVLVMRVQVAYQRFWEGVSQIMICSSKIGDAALQLMTFDEVQVRTGGGLSSGGVAGTPVFDEPGLEFRMHIIHFCSLFHAVSMLDIRGDDEFVTTQLTLNPEDPYLFRLHSTSEMPQNHGVLSSSRHDSRDSTPTMSRGASPYLRRLSTSNWNGWDSEASQLACAPSGEDDRRDGSASAASARSRSGPAAVPLQQVITARRRLTQEVGLPVDDSGKPTDGKPGSDSSVFNCISAVDAMEKGVQPFSPRQSLAVRISPRRGRLAASKGTTQQSPKSGSRFMRNFGAQAQPPPLPPLFPPPVKRRASATPPRRGIGTSLYEYFCATILLRPSRVTRDKLARSNCFDVVGGVSDVEMELLRSVPANERAYVVMTWLYRTISSRLCDGGLAIPAPLLSRTYQVLSEGTAASMQAHKLSVTPFPYPLRQLLGLMLLAFQVIVPMCIAAFVDSPPLVATLSFFVCLGYWSLNETALELEHPFGLGANHLPVVQYQDTFNSKLSRLLDVTVPELGFVPMGCTTFSNGAKVPVRPTAPASKIDCNGTVDISGIAVQA